MKNKLSSSNLFLWCVIILMTAIAVIANIEALSSFGRGFVKGFFAL